MIRFKLDIYTHGFHVKVCFQQDRSIMVKYSDTLRVFELRKVKGRRGLSRMLKHTYATFNPKTNTYGLHRNVIDFFLEHLAKNNVSGKEIQTTVHDLYDPKSNSLTLSDKAIPLPRQEAPIDFIMKAHQTCVLPLPTGYGKSQPLYCKIKTPTGWTTMGEIHVGDVVTNPVTNRDQLVTGVYPQGLLKNYLITFEDGRQTECGPDHLWEVYNKHYEYLIIMTAEELTHLQSEITDLSVRMLTSPISYNNCKLYDYSVGEISPNYRLRKDVLDRPNWLDFNLFRWLVTCITKDPTVLRHNIISIRPPNLELAKELVTLIRTLGGKAELIRTGEDYLARFDLTNIYSGGEQLSFKSIESNGSQVQQCISVDGHEHLYITDEGIVTHNTFCGFYTAAQIGTRTAIVMASRHINTWINDSKWIYEKHSDNINIIKGGSGIRKVIGQAKDGKLHASILIFSIDIIRNYLSEYDRNGTSTYGCDPIDFYETIGVGLRIVDEAHENLHFQFRHDIGTNCNKVIYLSATIESNDAFTNQMYDVIFPRRLRFSKFQNNKFADVFALGYGLRNPDEVRCLGPTKQYNHTVYEDWILKDHRRLANYLVMVTYVVSKGFIDRYVNGGKMVIFVAGIRMAKTISDHLKRKFPDKSHSPYTSEHDVEVLHTHDIIVTTPGSCSTGKDIKKLMTVLLTVSVGSRERNLQSLGRLRDLEKQLPGVDPIFYYLVCRDMENHIKNHNLKLKIYPAVTKSIAVRNMGFKV